jgi:4'-phosphopantetheinyl transferase
VGGVHGPGAASVFYAAPAAILAALPRARLLAWLSAKERARLARLRFEVDRDGYLVAQALKRRALAELCGVEPEQLEFRVAHFGRPEVSAPEPALALRFNLSHTRGLVACAVARSCAIGVDVENVEQNLELMSVARHVFSSGEQGELDGLLGVARQRRFFELWTLKQAYIKAVGQDVRPLRSIRFAAAGPDPVAACFEVPVADDAAGWSFYRHSPGPVHQLAVALRAPAPAAISFREIGATELAGSLLG